MGAKLNTRAHNYAKRQIGKKAWLLDPAVRCSLLDYGDARDRRFNYCLGLDVNGEPIHPFVKTDDDGHLLISRAALQRIADNPAAEGDIRAAAGGLVRRIDLDPTAVPGPFRRAYTGPLEDRGIDLDATAIFDVEDVQLRQADGDLPNLVGYAAVFDVLSEPMSWGREKIAKGAFARSIRERADVIATIEHEGGLNVIGRTAAGTLELREDKVGLAVEIDVPNTSAGRDVVELVKRGDLRQMSFAFRVVRQELDDSGEELVRTLFDVDLFDVSVVAIPAYRQTSVETDSDDPPENPEDALEDDGLDSEAEDDTGDTGEGGEDNPDDRSAVKQQLAEFGRRVDLVAAGVT